MTASPPLGSGLRSCSHYPLFQISTLQPETTRDSSALSLMSYASSLVRKDLIKQHRSLFSSDKQLIGVRPSCLRRVCNRMHEQTFINDSGLRLDSPRPLLLQFTSHHYVACLDLAHQLSSWFIRALVPPMSVLESARSVGVFSAFQRTRPDSVQCARPSSSLRRTTSNNKVTLQIHTVQLPA